MRSPGASPLSATRLNEPGLASAKVYRRFLASTAAKRSADAVGASSAQSASVAQAAGRWERSTRAFRGRLAGMRAPAVDGSAQMKLGTVPPSADHDAPATVLARAEHRKTITAAISSGSA